MGLSMVVRGPDLLARFAAMSVKAHVTAVAALGAELNTLFAITQDQVPVDTGALKASGQVSMDVTAGDIIQGSIGYGNDDVPYALVVHEDLTAHHDVGKAKYVEDPINQNSAATATRIGGALAVALLSEAME